MKKLLSVLFCLAILAGAFSAVAVSADTALISAGELNEAKPGDTVELPITLSGNPGVWHISLNVVYDNASFTLQEYKYNGTLFSEDDIVASPLTNSSAVIGFESATLNNVTGNGLLITLVFKVNDDITNGNYDFTLSTNADSTIDNTAKEIAFTTSGSTLKISGGAKATTPTTTVSAAAPVTDAAGTAADVTSDETTAAPIELGSTATEQSAVPQEKGNAGLLIILIIALVVVAAIVITVICSSASKGAAAADADAPVPPEAPATPEAPAEAPDNGDDSTAVPAEPTPDENDK